jgi:spore coat polysaccharide biosynthesis protein SpsF (cytidylyltransferase family)
MEGERLIGGVASIWLRRKRWKPGYGIYATDRRLIGVKTSKGYRALLVTTALTKSSKYAIQRAEEVSRSESDKTLREVEKNKDFEIAKEQISRIEITRPSGFKVGHLRIIPKSGSEIDIHVGADEDFESIGDLMKAFLPEATKLQD